MAKKTVKELVTKWGFQVDKKPLMEMKVQVAALKGELKSLGAVAITNALAIFGLADSTAHAANEARLAALRTGLTTQEFQKMSYAAKLSGVDAESFAHSMIFLNRNMFAARMGSKETQKAFQMLGGGVAQAVANGASGDTVFKMMADRFAAIKDPAKAGALSMDIFGRAGAQLLPLLKKGSAGIAEFEAKAEELGLVFDQDAIKDAEEFHESLEELKGSIVGFKNTIGTALLKPVTLVIKAISDWMRQNRALIKSQLTEFFKGLQQSLSLILVVFKRIGEVVIGLSNAFGGLGSALRIVVTAFTAMKLVQFLSTIGSMAMAVYEVASAWVFMGNAAALAQIKAVAVPLLIGAAIAAVILLVEDLIGAFQGKNSLLSVINNVLNNAFPNAMKTIDAWIMKVINGVQWLSHVFEGFTGGIEPQKAFAGLPATGRSQLLSEAPGRSAPTSNPYDLNQSSSSLSMGDINVNVASTNASPHEIGAAVHNAVFEKGFDNKMRAASRALAPGRKQ